MSATLILVLGGARSGKSSYAEKLAAEMGHQITYIATAEAKDEEMSARIQAHRLQRPSSWQTLESPYNVAEALTGIKVRPDVLLLDCLTLLISNILLSMEALSPAAIEAAVQTEIKALLTVHQELAVPLIVVSNEVGLGLVPPYSLGRTYRDLLGRANQQLAAVASKVIFMVAGLPLLVKESSHESI